MRRILFACVHNAGRSQMAAAILNAEARPAKARAISAGTQPGSQVHPEVILTMRELGIDLAQAKPSLLTEELARGVSMLTTMGCGEACPAVSGIHREDWPLADPKGRPEEEVRRIRDEIRRRVHELVMREGWA